MLILSREIKNFIQIGAECLFGFHLGEYYLDDKEKYFGKKNLELNDEESVERRLEDLPDTLNWVDAGAITGVKDQSKGCESGKYLNKVF